MSSHLERLPLNAQEQKMLNALASTTEAKTFLETLFKKQEKQHRKMMEWMAGDDTGISSMTIAQTLMGLKVERPDIPYDPADFGRCYRLLKKFPEFKKRLPEVSARFPEWKPFVDNWDRMTRLYERDIPKRGSSELYRLMQGFRNEVKNPIPRGIARFQLNNDSIDLGDAHLRKAAHIQVINQIMTGNKLDLTSHRPEVR